jgi:hypothetical protein
VRADLLARNPLLGTALISRSDSAPEALRNVLAETARTLFDNEQDHKL